MVKKLFVSALGVLAVLLGSILHDLVKDGSIAFSGVTLPGTLGGIVAVIILLALLESPRNLVLTWRWHRFWYFTEVLKDRGLRRWEHDFALLQAVRKGQPFSVSEVVDGEGRREDLVDTLFKTVTSRKSVARALVVGEPGSGKTTAIERLTLDLARRGIRRLGTGTPIPILVRLGNLQPGSFQEALEHALSNSVGGSSGRALSNGLDDLLRKGRAVLLFDALDEALGERQDLVLTAIRNYLQESAYRKTPIVVTARTREMPSSPEFPTRLEIQELNSGATSLIISAYKPQGEKESDIRERLDSLGLLAPGALGRNPFWLILLVSTGVSDGNKSQILDSAVNRLLAAQWDKPKTKRTWRALLSRDRQLAETRQALASLAFEMSSTGRLAMDHGRAAALIDKYLSGVLDRDHFGAYDVIGLAQDALLLNYSPQLDRRAPITFRHRLLQQFFTAWYWISNPDSLTADAVVSLTQSLEWWETFLLWAALAPDCSAPVRSLVDGGGEKTLLAIGMLASSPHPDAGLQRVASRALVQSVQGKLTETQAKAAVLLGKSEGSATAGFVEEFLDDSDLEIAYKGIAILSAMKTRAAAQVLADKLRLSHLRLGLVDALAAMGPVATAPLLAALDDPDAGVREAAAVALGQVNDPTAIEPLAAHLRDSDRVARAVASALVWLGDSRGSQVLLAPFQDEHWSVRAKCAEELGKLGNTGLIEPLLKVLRSEAGLAGWAVARSLRELGRGLMNRGRTEEAEQLRSELETEVQRLQMIAVEAESSDHERVIDNEDHNKVTAAPAWSGLQYAIVGETTVVGSTEPGGFRYPPAVPHLILGAPAVTDVPTLAVSVPEVPAEGRALGDKDAPAPMSWQDLDNALSQGAAGHVAKEMGQQAVRPLLTAFRVGDAVIRRHVVQALGNTEARGLFKTLTGLAASNDDSARRYAHDVLVYVSHQSPSIDVRTQANVMLQKLAMIDDYKAHLETFLGSPF